jgi:hypothetical protein
VLVVYLVLFTIIYNFSGIPKVIWTYWHDDDLPNTVRNCIRTWQETNPDYTIIILNNDRLHELTGNDLSKLNITNTMRARYADFARLFIMAKYGGVWMDSSIICTQPLSKVLPRSFYDMVGYYAPHTTNKKFPIPENWFFAAPPNSRFIHDWLMEALFMTNFKSEQAYIDYVKSELKVDIQELESALPYLAMHLCATVIQQKNVGSYRLHLLDGRKGPFLYLDANNWELPRAFEKLCEDSQLQTPLIKMRGLEREYLENNRVSCHTDNKYIKYVLHDSNYSDIKSG